MGAATGMTGISGFPGWVLRRAVMAPLMPVALIVALLLSLLVLVTSAVLWPFRRIIGRRKPRWRALRVLVMADVYLLGECLCVLACLELWIVSGFGWRLTQPPMVQAHRRLLATFLGLLIATSGPLFGFRLMIEEPERHPDDLDAAGGDEPVLVLARHAGPGASFALVHLLLTRYGRQVHVVLKDTLRLDPAIDLLLSRTNCTWIRAGRTTGDGAAEQVGLAASALLPRQALLLFPEGADWTPLRRVAAIAKLHRRGLIAQARQALRMPHVLPPRPAGAMAALAGAPHADVLIFTHTGHDQLLDASSAWAAIPLKQPLQMTWWREPAAALPRDTEDAVQDWLQTTWTNIDAWISERQALSMLQDAPP
ncbi:MAG: hypothetical protein NVS3B26_08620 [Mycobacteriales bacterium]